MDLVEKAGKALYELWAEEDFDHEYCSWELLPSKAIWLERGCAVLMAIREPTEEMSDAGYYTDHDTFVFTAADAAECWKRMIDTALTSPASTQAEGTDRSSLR